MRSTRRDVLKMAAAAAALPAIGPMHPLLAAVPKTKITKVETISVSRFTYVKIHTDAGVQGIGELHAASNTSGTVFTPIAAVKYCEEYLLGQDPTQIERHWQHMFRRNIFRGGADSMAAIGACDIALWDIAGKLAGLPVYKLLGGPTREKVRLYPHMGGNSPEEMADRARMRVEQGYSAVRFYPLGNFGDPKFADLTQRELALTAEKYVSAVRKAVGPNIEILIDVVCRLTPPEAIAMGQALAPYGVYFFEDPIESDNIDMVAYVASKLPMPVAFGERLYTVYQFQETLNKKAAAFLRPDLSLAGGITNCRKIAALAEASYVGIIPHNPLSCVLTAACIQVCFSVQNVPIQEYPGDEFDKPKRDLVKEPLKFERGYVLAPDKPGIGVELNEEAFKHYPPSRGKRPALVGRDGLLKDY